MYLLGISLFLLPISGCGRQTNTENEARNSDKTWITLDEDTIESDENGQF